ncbi:protein of unknown function [Hyphomicrobium sp. MC1]|nr:protein of unknown function [Hyphomicrobium sp. MC1]
MAGLLVVALKKARAFLGLELRFYQLDLQFRP